ncbi:MAG TPA: hypothetical protein VFD81_10425 [Methylomirabilota bacterium]|nr:hypothetical protein [Methylomirabilota bacterium]
MKKPLETTQCGSYWAIPEDIQQKLALAAGTFKRKTGAQFTDIQDFMITVLQIYDEYMTRKEPVH